LKQAVKLHTEIFLLKCRGDTMFGKTVWYN